MATVKYTTRNIFPTIILKDGKVSCVCCEVCTQNINTDPRSPLIEVTKEQFLNYYKSGTVKIDITSSYTINQESFDIKQYENASGSGSVSFRKSKGCAILTGAFLSRFGNVSGNFTRETPGFTIELNLAGSYAYYISIYLLNRNKKYYLYFSNFLLIHSVSGGESFWYQTYGASAIPFSAFNDPVASLRPLRDLSNATFDTFNLTGYFSLNRLLGNYSLSHSTSCSLNIEFTPDD
jgi:hypothetical protein